MIRSIRMQAPETKIECLTPDFRGEEMPLARVIAERPDVFNHNLEVAPRLYPVARRGSTWKRSLRVLRNALEMGEGEVATKSGLMVGFGETHEELVDAFGEMREAGVQILTVGQYLRPTERHLPVVRYWAPEEFTALERPPTSSASSTSRPARSCAPATTRTSTSSRTGPGIGPLAAATCRGRSVTLFEAARGVGVQALAQRELQRELLTAHGRPRSARAPPGTPATGGIDCTSAPRSLERRDRLVHVGRRRAVGAQREHRRARVDGRDRAVQEVARRRSPWRSRAPPRATFSAVSSAAE